jgi:hypothetical protein
LAPWLALATGGSVTGTSKSVIVGSRDEPENDADGLNRARTDSRYRGVRTVHPVSLGWFNLTAPGNRADRDRACRDAPPPTPAQLQFSPAPITHHQRGLGIRVYAAQGRPGLNAPCPDVAFATQTLLLGGDT